MIRSVLLGLFCTTSVFFVFSQKHWNMDTLKSPNDFENVHVQILTHDSLQSVFVIWVKKEVKGHFHAEHTECIVVLEGKAVMRLNDQVIQIKRGDVIQVPSGTKHAVLEVKGRKNLKVLSIQSPYFDGTDRIFIQDR
jgi:quercetin dioxygenase-like cupin family protein